MKKILYLIGLLTVLTIYSCSKFLDVVPDNVATLDNAFADRYTAERFLVTCYSYLPNFASTDGNPGLNSGDEIWYAEWHKWKSGVKIAKGQQNITSPLYDFWRGSNGGKPLYTGIRDCNIFLENIENVQGLNAQEKKRWIAEVNFLKAYYHYYLTRMYGPVHIVDKNLPVSAQTDAIRDYRQPVDSCFNYIVRLLDKSIADLPAALENSVTELGRITKPIAMAVKAEVLVTAASPLFNGNTSMASMVDNRQVHLFSASADPTKWQKAATACLEAINASHSAGVSLFQKTDYLNPYPISDTTRTIAALRAAVSNLWNKEIIWGCSNATTGDLQWNSCPRLYTSTYNPVGSNHAPTLAVAEQFYTRNGVPIDEDPSWSFENRYSLRTATAADAIFVEPGEKTVYLNYNREYRYYAALSFDRGAWFGNGKETDELAPWYIRNRKGDFSSIFEISQYSITGFYPKKLVNLGSNIQNGSYFKAEIYAFPVLRLADLYLYYAEALNEVKDAPDEEVYRYIDLVRNRAGLKGVVDSWAEHSKFPGKPATKSGMREIIHRERMIELAFEGQRYWDLRRWKQAKIYMNKPVQGWDVFETDPLTYYRVTTLFNQTFDERDYFWPVPENEIIKNPNLVQNLGW